MVRQGRVFVKSPRTVTILYYLQLEVIPVSPGYDNAGTSCLAVTKNASVQNCTVLEQPLVIMQPGEGVCLVQVTMLVVS